MKKALFLLLLPVYWHAHAQNNLSESVGTIKLGGGYSKDFPGLSGYAINAEYTYAMHQKLEGGFGIKRINMKGYPRTSAVKEYTKASTIDFNINFLPLADERNSLKFGLGYSFSFYKTRRSYPLVETQGSNKITTWPIKDQSGRSSGITLSAEYEYLFSPDFSMGLKASFCKAYDRIFYIGPYAGIRL